MKDQLQLHEIAGYLPYGVAKEDLKTEVWEEIPNYNGIYFVSNLGRVKSIDRNVFNKGNNSNCFRKGKVLRPNKDSGGYLYVGLYSVDGNKTSSIKIHRLVAHAFCDGYSEGLEVNHKDGIRHNNTVNNLEWVTKSQNMRDVYKRGFNTNGEKGNNSKLKDSDIGVIASLYDQGVSQGIIAKAFNVHQATISNVIRNKHYKNNLIGRGLAIDANALNNE